MKVPRTVQTRRALRVQPSVVLFVIVSVVVSTCQVKADEPRIADGRATFGTAIEWTNDLEAASRQAREQSKLVFVIHISGNFTKQTFT